MRHEM